jgi:hypothetical protein
MHAEQLKGRAVVQDAIEQIAAALRGASNRKEKCTLLIGAGCSMLQSRVIVTLDPLRIGLNSMALPS